MSTITLEGSKSRYIPMRIWFYAGVFLFILVFPPVAEAAGRSDLVSFFSLIMTFAMAAVSLNLILGYGGMISFGHAAFMAIGGYTVGISTYYDITSGFIHLPLAIVLAALFALITGAICLRTRGVYFIMITLAFAQMLFFGFVSIEEYGGDDGLTINSRSDFAGLVNLENDIVLYYVIFAFLLASLYLVHRLVNSRFGWVIRGAKSNDARMQALGFSTYRYRLTCFVIAGVICAIAGVLFANYANFVNPDDTAWTTSGELIFMVVLGGMGTLIGPVLGAGVYLMMEHFISELPVVGIYWKIYFGPFLVLVVIYARGGIDSWLVRTEVPEGESGAALKPAPASRRLLAAVIDLAFAAGLFWLLLAAGPVMMELPQAEHHKHFVMVVMTYALLIGLFVNHFVLPCTQFRGSVGKMIAGIAVVSANGATLSQHQAVQRVFGQLVSVATALIGYFLFLFDPKARAAHDRLASTRVVIQGGANG